MYFSFSLQGLFLIILLSLWTETADMLDAKANQFLEVMMKAQKPFEGYAMIPQRHYMRF